MRIKFFLIFIFLIYGVEVSAQNSVLTIKVSDDLSDQTLPFALIELKGGVVSKRFASDKEGVFTVRNLSAGIYNLHTSYLGYQARDTVLVIGASLQNSVVIRLKPSSNELREVKVESKKPYLIMSKGKLILNISDSPLASSGNLWNALKYAPTVETSVTGKLTIKDQPVVVYLDGKRIYLGGADLMNYLQSINAGNTDQIEIIAHPGSSYSSDIQTVINIKSLKLKQDGIRNNLDGTGTLGHFPRYNLSDNIIVNKAPYNFQVNYNFNTSKYDNTRIYNTINKGIYPWETNQLTDTKQQQQRISASLNADVTKNTVLSFYSEVQPGHSRVNSLSGNGSPTPERIQSRDSIFLFNSYVNNKTLSSFFQTSLETKWDSTRQAFKIQLEYFGNSKKYLNNYNTRNFISGAFQDANSLRDSLPQNLHTFIMSTEYRKNVVQWDFIIGGRYSLSNLSNFNSTISTVSEELLAQSDLKYTEANYAAFTNLSREFNKFYLSFGARFEQLDVSVDNHNGTPDKKFDLSSFLPSALFQWKITQVHVLELSYKKNIVKPDYFQLNNFKRYNGNTLADFRGNEDIKAQVNQTVDLTWTRANALSISAGIMFMKNYINTLYLLDENQEMFQQYLNFPHANIYYVAAGYVYNPFKFWQIRLNANSFLADVKLKGVESVKATPSANITYINSFTVARDWVLESALFFNNTFKDGFFEHRKYGFGQFAIQKSIPRQNLTITLSGNLRFGSDDASSALYNNISYRDRSYSDANILSLGISWNIGKLNVKTVSKQKSEADESRARTKEKNKSADQ